MKTYLRVMIIVGALFATLAPRDAQAQQMPYGYGMPIPVEHARKAAAAAVAEAHKNGWTVAVAVVDPAGELVFFERMDSTQMASVLVSQEKARTAARFKRPSKAFEDAVAGGRTAIMALPGVTPVEGGVPIVIDNKIVGAIGVSGATSPQDAQCAIAGAETLGKQPAAPRPATPAAPRPATPPAPPRK